MSNVTLLSSRGTWEEVVYILRWMPVKQLENLQYNIPSLFNVSDHVIEIRSIKYKNDIHLHENLFFFGAPEIQHSAVEFSLTYSMGDDERT